MADRLRALTTDRLIETWVSFFAKLVLFSFLKILMTDYSFSLNKIQELPRDGAKGLFLACVQADEHQAAEALFPILSFLLPTDPLSALRIDEDLLRCALTFYNDAVGYQRVIDRVNAQLSEAGLKFSTQHVSVQAIDLSDLLWVFGFCG